MSIINYNQAGLFCYENLDMVLQKSTID